MKISTIINLNEISQAADLKAIQDEIRRLKTVIVKHENRIRALEAQPKSRDEDNNDEV